MSKSLIRFTLLSSMVIPFAVHADVKVYGHAQAELATYSNESVPASENNLSKNAATLGTPKDNLLEEDNARGRVGIKASEDLGMGGLKGIAAFEWKVDTTNNAAAGTTPFTPRESYVGLQGGFGSVVLGNIKAPYKYAGGVTYDAFVTTALEARGKGGMAGGVGLDKAFGQNGFFPKAIGYNTPEMGGISAQLALRLDEESSAAEKDGAWMAALQFKSGPIHLFIAANNDDLPDTGTTVNEYSAVKVGGKFSAGNIAVMAQYEMIDNKGVDENVIFLGAQMKIDKATLVLQLGQDEYDGIDTTANKFDAVTYAVLGGIYSFSKETRIFGGYRATSDFENVFTVGIRKDFST